MPDTDITLKLAISHLEKGLEVGCCHISEDGYHGKGCATESIAAALVLLRAIDAVRSFPKGQRQRKSQ